MQVVCGFRICGADPWQGRIQAAVPVKTEKESGGGECVGRTLASSVQNSLGSKLCDQGRREPVGSRAPWAFAKRHSLTQPDSPPPQTPAWPREPLVCRGFPQKRQKALGRGDFSLDKKKTRPHRPEIIYKPNEVLGGF